MKRHFLLLIAIALYATAVAATASGQTVKTIRSNVKFDFHIGDLVFPAGEYQIESVSGQSDNILIIRSQSDAKKNQIVIANHSNAAKKQTPRLVFRKYGEDYFLTEIILDTQQWGYSLHPSRRQRQSEKDLARVSLERN